MYITTRYTLTHTVGTKSYQRKKTPVCEKEKIIALFLAVFDAHIEQYE